MVRSNFGGELSKMSMTYLRVSGNASGSVNLPMPIKAAPTTKRRYGLRNPANLKITDFENFSTSGFIHIPQAQMKNGVRCRVENSALWESNGHALPRPLNTREILGVRGLSALI